MCSSFPGFFYFFSHLALLSCNMFSPWVTWPPFHFLLLFSHSRGLSLCKPWTVAHQPSLSFTISWSFCLTHFHWVTDAIRSSRPLSSPFPPTFNFFQHQGLFKSISSSHQVLKYWSFNFSISPSNEYSGLISFRIDCFDLLVVQGTLKSLLQHHNSKASILWCSAFFMVQLSQPYMTTGKTIVLTRQTFVSKVKSLLLIHCLGLS